MTMRYEPATGPDARSWLELPESERTEAVREHHRRVGQQAGSPEVHAIIHTAVETQLAEGHAPKQLRPWSASCRKDWTAMRLFTPSGRC